ncbi:preprotein translocase subunit YajC [Aminicella lysinilytica]|jgi:preprotein translocase subunit YajC|uniref:Preprotein translocase YajC subunit n=1 Tax=Aminicella lysinilytica TaxID=433323 RepID=A0A4R6Q7Q2_9FIRM|nr:preprotein translocase subunit YajC [Aminicella lysinilytica]TDP58548.1 preprotein translocase YajC subunit [Aminicella lysinilytica]
MKLGTILLATKSTTGFAFQMLILVAFIILMYFLLVRPQKKKEKTVKAMRDAIRVGDEVITIGGICGKIVKTKDETLIIQVGADKLKFEVMRWAVSSVVSKSNRPAESTAKEDFDDDEEETSRKSAPRRLKKVSSDKEESSDDAKKSE